MFPSIPRAPSPIRPVRSSCRGKIYRTLFNPVHDVRVSSTWPAIYIREGSVYRFNVPPMWLMIRGIETILCSWLRRPRDTDRVFHLGRSPSLLIMDRSLHSPTHSDLPESIGFWSSYIFDHLCPAKSVVAVIISDPLRQEYSS